MYTYKRQSGDFVRLAAYYLLLITLKVHGSVEI